MKLKKSEMNRYKSVQIGSGKNSETASINTEKAFSNTQNVSIKDEDSSANIFTKLPKIQKHLTSSILSGIKNLNSNNLFIKDNDSSNSYIINQKYYSSLNNDDNLENNNNIPFRVYTN